MNSKATCKGGTFHAGDLKLKGFKVQEITGPSYPVLAYGRRDCYKIVLGTGDMHFCYGDQTIDINGTFLFFANPHIPYSCEHRSPEQKGYACLFTQGFIGNRERKDSLLNASIFRFEGTPVIPVNRKQAAFIGGIYQRMLSVYSGDYARKDEMIRSCIDLIIHEALSIQPQPEQQQKNAATRITYLFMELLEKQFPIVAAAEPLSVRTAQDFAARLAVHENYLNRAVKEVTGKPVSVHIAERITAEAKALLQHTSWSVADIAYGLGFEYPSYFNNYFKRVTGSTPNSFRKDKRKV
ncbi:helix-turn-helix domain-containing protein [Chitinophaga nivalis]|uniref:Helix-turn-helix domain-containing protein n=1 Tax=Chitinophaga nivalis TaxID=2991709 RepID=A0ABT3IMX5_9BACT|nr:helix-turn-helix domain-containing protein [Chitinophaga nivalis]MCW3464987.1 helix-turn-helix domain-containing protein [Chitinophaga nivalis]MCW3485321.1 helix-turn-helix domain-containing protein [Chitinophaga nivalis]